MEKIKRYKFNEKKCNPDMSLIEVIAKQFDLDGSKKIHVNDLYMPEEEQDKMKDWILNNTKEVLAIPKVMRDRQLSMAVLDFFPSFIE